MENNNQFLLQIQKEAKVLAIQELEKELLEEKDYAHLEKLTKLKEKFLEI
ncbi:MAG: hypothetical protein Q7S33_03910 [Nanoarchaeota archaeon]|nr:hypothetical protein [Nanoarchaeota archaeon]